MKPGLSRFEYYFNQLQPILTTASRQKNPALWLYRNDARTPLFMLEALSRLYSNLHNKKRFLKLTEHFKMLEDTLGAIDYYDVTAKDLVANKKIPASVISYLQAQSREKLQLLNEQLAENDWLSPQKNRLTKMIRKLTKADWLPEQEEIKAIEYFFGETIYNIVEFTRETNCTFDNMEADVHELRRKMRWLSIYAQSLRGAVQLQTKETFPRHLAKYNTPAIMESPYNQMPPPGNAKAVLYLDGRYFYALSWMIAELGNLKDNGLHVIAVQEALEQTASLSEAEALKKAYQLLGAKQVKLPELLNQASTLARQYFKEQNLENLVKGSQIIAKA